MKRIKQLCLILAVLLIMACGLFKPETPEYLLMGEWEYTLVDQNGDIYDEGNLLFTGGLMEGEYLQTNDYGETYTGTYKLDGNKITLSGALKMKGEFQDASNISGTWENENDQASGTWRAKAKINL